LIELRGGVLPRTQFNNSFISIGQLGPQEHTSKMIMYNGQTVRRYRKETTQTTV